MIELEEPGVSAKPDWLELPGKSSYWACLGQDIKPPRKWWQREVAPERYWRRLCYSKEDAEAYAAIPVDTWKWDGLPARQFTLADTMFEVRRDGDMGVRVMSYRYGAWHIVKEYPADVPLPDCERSCDE